MNSKNIEIGEQQYVVTIVKTPREIKKGLRGRVFLEDDAGMLFDLTDYAEDMWFWMKGVQIPLDIIFINDNLEVTDVFKGKPNSGNKLSVPDTLYVLEVNQDSGIEEGDKLEFIEGDPNPPVMKVLFQDGSTQAELWGGERIFRREFTAQLIRLCKKAKVLSKRKCDSDKLNSLYRSIGKKMFKEIKAQDERPPEYVDVPN